MRLHHLSIQAFGPFAGAEEIDFDELSDAGLFLLTGPTGAGKTTILDAVCFALYGSVPGARGVKALKSQHAPDDARPEVVLDFSVRDRRFVVRRSPEWTRPKRRGAGFTTQNASATLVETTTGEDHLLSSRAQEVGHFVGELIGMQATQFVQVAMLPQGDFQKFLRASSQDRHGVLQHLFKTDRYARIEDWVHDHSRALRERSDLGRQDVVRVLDTVAERANVPLPEDLGGAALDAPEAQPAALAWVDVLLTEAEAARSVAAEAHTAASDASAAARTALEEGRRRGELHARRAEARTVLQGLDDAGSAAEAARLALDADTRAASCLPVLRMLDEAVATRSRTDRAREQAALRLQRGVLGGLELPEHLDTEGLALVEQQARSRSARLEGLLPREVELQAAQRRLTVTRVELAEAEGDAATTAQRVEQLPAALEQARALVTDLAADASRSEALGLELEQARRRHRAALEAATCAATLPGLRDAERDARDRAADARERVQDLTALRLAGIAAELAGRLAEGEPCQVCGSTQHPAPASATEDRVTDAEQQAAAAALEAASEVLAAASGEVLRAQERLDGLRAAADGLDPEATSAQVEDLVVALTAATRAATDVESGRKTVDQLSEELRSAEQAAHELALTVARLRQTVETDERAVETLTVELGAEADLATPLATQIAVLEEAARALATAREAWAGHDAAARAAEELEEHAARTAADLGFESLAMLREAVLEPDDRADLLDHLESVAQARARAEAVLADASLLDLDESPMPDVAVLSAAADAAEERTTANAAELHRRDDLLASLRRQRERLEDAFTAWAPVRGEYLRADSMSRLVRGTGADNQLQMRLSAYVLATRLDQVVAAANERLAHMRDQRYLLQRTGRAARKGSQAGLGLEVVDQWTGDVRDPATLSGGETFVVSLSLALGLADVVTQEAGGTEIETLFVDEGFGTLDADTLDDVMDRLDDLRAGGRAVGVVSHVSEMRNRIPTQLHVEKRRDGSTVAVRTAVG